MKAAPYLRRVLLVVAASTLACSRTEPVPSGPPNLVFILTDDQRMDAMGAYGNSLIHTPHMDRLAAEAGIADTELANRCFSLAQAEALGAARLRRNPELVNQRLSGIRLDDTVLSRPARSGQCSTGQPRSRAVRAKRLRRRWCPWESWPNEPRSARVRSRRSRPLPSIALIDSRA